MEASDDGAGAAAADPVAQTRRLCVRCVQQIPVDGAAISVRGEAAHIELLFATDSVIARLDDLQFVLGEGPCWDAYRDRIAVTEPDLASEAASRRWTGFSREAATAGAGALFAFPLQVGGVPFGVLEMYRKRPGELSHEEMARATAFADSAARVVISDFTDGDAAATDVDPNPMFQRSEVPQATGMIAVQHGISLPTALDELRAAAFAQNRSITSVAADVVNGRLSLIADSDPQH